jgi:hypothetical protein
LSVKPTGAESRYCEQRENRSCGASNADAPRYQQSRHACGDDRHYCGNVRYHRRVFNGPQQRGGHARLERAPVGGIGAVIAKDPVRTGLRTGKRKGRLWSRRLRATVPQINLAQGRLSSSLSKRKKTRPFLTGRSKYLGWFADGKHQHIELQLAPPCATSISAVRRSYERKALRRHLSPE